MRCTSLRTVGFHPDGKTLCWSKKNYSKEFAPFQLPCGKCISCRLEYARQWAVRCSHEASMYEKNSFITLTYSDQHLESPKLIYSDWQNFAKKLRKVQNDPIGIYVVGEYGAENKRPHWHAIIFNWYPADATYYRSNERGDRLFTSEKLDELWGKNDPDQKPNEIGAVTFESAGYVARYSAKKLVHGYDQSHDYKPICRASSKHAIGKRWLEKFHTDIFNHGQTILPDGRPTGVPRYYEKWLKKFQPESWIKYVTETKLRKTEEAVARNQKELDHYHRVNADWSGKTLTRDQVRAEILRHKFNQLQKYQKDF